MTSSNTPRVDLTKPVTTRDGRAVRILCTDFKHPRVLYPTLALVTEPSGVENVRTYTEEGLYSEKKESVLDLINPKQKLYLLVWSDCGVLRTSTYQTKEEQHGNATAVKALHRCKFLATMEIEVDL